MFGRSCAASNHRLLRMNLILNQLENRVVTKNVVVGDRVDEVDIHVPKECNFSSIEAPEGSAGEMRVEKVAMLTFTEFYNQLELCEHDGVLIRCNIGFLSHDLDRSQLVYQSRM